MRASGGFTRNVALSTILLGLNSHGAKYDSSIAFEYDELLNWEGCSLDSAKVWVSTNNCYSTLDPVDVRHFELVM